MNAIKRREVVPGRKARWSAPSGQFGWSRRPRPETAWSDRNREAAESKRARRRAARKAVA